MTAGRPNQPHRLGAIRLAESVEEQILTLQRATDRRPELALQRLGQTEQQRIRQVDDVELLFPDEPLEELADFLRLEPVLAAQHRDGHLAQALRIHLDLTLRREPDDPRRVPQAIEHPRRPSEERHLLLEKDADPAEEHLRLAHVPLVGAGRRVHRRQDDVVAAREQGGGQGVVPQAAPAVHLAGAARERQDPHASAAARTASADC